MATHLFNAMTSIQGRDPGTVGATFDSPDVFAGIIADGIHVDYANVKLAKRVKGEKLMLVSDAIALVGTDMTEFEFGGNTVYLKEGKCLNKDGTLGGAILTMNEAVRNCI